MKQLKASLVLKIILIFGFLLRLFYIFVGARFISTGNSIFLTGDSHTYTEPILNLLRHGIYSFDLQNPDAAFGRLPGYPIFWSLHYFIFGEYAYQAVAVTQGILDTLSILLIYRICNSIQGNKWLSLVVAFIYSCYFFVIVWLPITGTEALATFAAVLFLYILSKEKYQSLGWYVLLAAIACLCFYIREYLGILGPITGVYFLALWLRKKIAFKSVAVFGFTFLFLYALWPLRNWYSFERVMFFKTESTGYDYFERDYTSFRKWVYAWGTDIEPYFSRMQTGQAVNFPIDVFSDSAEFRYANDLAAKAASCGSSYYAWKYERKMPGQNCNDEIEEGFDNLRLNFKKREPVWYHLKAPLQNFKKAFFKNDLYRKPNKHASLSKILFGWRSLLIIVGFVGLVFMRRHIVLAVIYGFAIFMYLFLCYLSRHIEIRYFLQADVYLIIGTIGPLAYFLNDRGKKFLKHNSKHASKKPLNDLVPGNV